jgi:3',5'-cyclic AMP phosphodiesterase CpdA
MQKVYKEEPHYLGDDETTIVFTQNVTRISEAKASENKEDENEIITNENIETSEYEELSLEFSPTFEGMIKEMMNLPDNHDAWAYMNPTMFYFDGETSSQNLNQIQAQHVKDFHNWLDGTLFLDHEFKERTQYNQLSSLQSDSLDREATINEETFNIDPQEEQGSSSVDEKPINKIN